MEFMERMVKAPRSKADWDWNNPRRAVLDFLAENHDFALKEPVFPFNEGLVDNRVTYWPDGFLKRIR